MSRRKIIGQVLDKAASDASFLDQLIKDPAAAIAASGIDFPIEEVALKGECTTTCTMQTCGDLTCDDTCSGYTCAANYTV